MTLAETQPFRAWKTQVYALFDAATGILLDDCVDTPLADYYAEGMTAAEAAAACVRYVEEAEGLEEYEFEPPYSIEVWE